MHNFKCLLVERAQWFQILSILFFSNFAFNLTNKYGKKVFLKWLKLCFEIHLGDNLIIKFLIWRPFRLLSKCTSVIIRYNYMCFQFKISAMHLRIAKEYYFPNLFFLCYCYLLLLGYRLNCSQIWIGEVQLNENKYED